MGRNEDQLHKEDWAEANRGTPIWVNGEENPEAFKLVDEAAQRLAEPLGVSANEFRKLFTEQQSPHAEYEFAEQEIIEMEKFAQELDLEEVNKHE